MGALGKDNAYELNFNVDEEEYNVSLGDTFFKEELNLDSLQKLECIKIKYSKITPSLIKLIDDRVMAN